MHHPNYVRSMRKADVSHTVPLSLAGVRRSKVQITYSNATIPHFHVTGVLYWRAHDVING
jgi:hypothetical protein